MGLFEVLRALQEKIKRCIDEIQPQLCGKVMKNLDEMYFTIRLKNKNSLLYLIQILRQFWNESSPCPYLGDF